MKKIMISEIKSHIWASNVGREGKGYWVTYEKIGDETDLEFMVRVMDMCDNSMANCAVNVIVFRKWIVDLAARTAEATYVEKDSNANILYINELFF